jgi:hypothetical protein
MFVFQDGKVQKGTWKKTSNKAQFQFKDGQGQTIKLNPGQTWLSAVADAGKVAYK